MTFIPPITVACPVAANVNVLVAIHIGVAGDNASSIGRVGNRPLIGEVGSSAINIQEHGIGLIS